DIAPIKRAAEVLEKDITRPYPLAVLAREVGINTFKLSTGFKQVYKLTVFQFRLKLRLSLAVQLLENTDFSIKQIAFKTGFDSRDSMARAFKQKLGRTPSQWRYSNCSASIPESFILKNVV